MSPLDDIASGSGRRATSTPPHPERTYWVIVTVFVVVGLVALGGFADLAWGIVYGSPLRYGDVALARAFMATRTPAWTLFFKGFTHLGDISVVAVITLAAAVSLWTRRLRGDAVFVLVATLTASLLNTRLKELVMRTRPPAMLAAVPLPRSPSFPSGHTVAGFVLFGTLAIVTVVELGPTWRGLGLGTVLATAGVLIGFSRVYLGVHWGTDVLGGWLLGTAWVSLWTAVWLAACAVGPLARFCGPAGTPAEGG